MKMGGGGGGRGDRVSSIRGSVTMYFNGIQFDAATDAAAAADAWNSVRVYP